MLQANQPHQPATNQGEMGQTVNQAQQASTTTHNAQRTKIQPLRGTLYAVGVSPVPRIANSEFGISINQFDRHRNRFFEVIERVRFLDGAGVLTDRIVLDVRGLIVEIVAYDDDPYTCLVKIGEAVCFIRKAALILVFLHLAKRSRA